MENMQERDKIIVRTSVIGIAANLLLAAFKALVGLAANSIAVVLDAVNNLSDALSSVVTIIGTKLANKEPDKKHPLGYGRIEYLSEMFVAGLVLFAGLNALEESVKKIITPEEPQYTAVSLIVIGAAVAVKILLGLYVRKQGKKVDSGALVASGTDALSDAVLSASVFASALIYIKTGVSLEAYVGVVIAVVIVKAGIEMMIDTVNEIIGQRTDPEVSSKIKKLLSEEESVRGAYDLVLNNYGPNRNLGSVHVELPDNMTVEQVDALTRKLEQKVYKETGVILTGIGVYSYNTGNDEAAVMRNRVQKIVLAHDYVLQMHGFYVDTEKKDMRFDVVISFDKTVKEAMEELSREVSEAFPEYTVHIQPDRDISD